MKFTLNEFLEKLPELVSGINKVIVATYNNLDDYEQGGELDAGNRKISILCGGGAYANLEGAQATKTAGLKTVSDGLVEVSSDTFVVLYAGNSRFNEVSRLGYRLAERGVKVAIVSCGCDLSVFDGFAYDQNISLVTPRNSFCNGGRGDLSRIVSRLLK